MYSQELKDKMYKYLFKEGNTQTLNKINEDRDENKYPHFNETKRKIETATNFLPEDIDFNARIYCIENDIHERPVCKICGKEIIWNKTHKKYSTHCSKKCVNNDKSIRKRMDEKKKKNSSYIKSDSEEQAFLYLRELFGEVKRQYKDNIRYPFNCDFYIPHLDFFIEINVNWTHGGEPFNENNVMHQMKVKEWREKAEDSQFYKNALIVWTEYDIKKFRYANSNNLNFVAIYNWKDKNDFLWQVTKGLKSVQNYQNNSINITYPMEVLQKELKSILNKEGSIVSPPVYNKIVLSFQPHFYKKEKELYKNPEIKEKLLSNREVYLNKNRDNLSNTEILSGFKKSGIYYGYSHFNPLWVKYFIDKYNINSIYDPCGGWGHRLLGAWNIDYIYNDTDYRTKEGVEYIWKTFKEDNQSIKIFYNKDASTFTPGKHYEAVFTCPPYFKKEEYYGTNDSVKLYPNYEEWLNKWWRNVVKKSYTNASKYFVFVINNELKDDMKKVVSSFDLELVEENIVGSVNTKSHFQNNRSNYEYLIVYKRTKPIQDAPIYQTRCEVCHKPMKSLRGLKKHLSMAHPELDRKWYYNSYLKPNDETIKCPYCDNDKLFNYKGMHYWNTCGSNECIRKINSEKVREHHNRYTREDWDTILEKRKETNKEKYGVEWVMQSEDVQQTRRENNLKKYGNEHYSQTKQWKEQVIGKKRN